jgi:general secretion pathway protein G
MNIRQKRHRVSGISLIELLIVLAIVGIASSLSFQAYEDYILSSKISKTAQQIRAAELLIYDYRRFELRNPPDLEAVGFTILDAWGNPYQYLDIEGGGKKTRKDKNLTPINSDFDLYSMGPDGATSLPLTAKMARDDIVRANNGRYIGIASGY